MDRSNQSNIKLSVACLQLETTPRTLKTVRDALASSLKEPHNWLKLLSEPSVAAYLRQTLVRLVMVDSDLSRTVASALNIPQEVVLCNPTDSSPFAGPSTLSSSLRAATQVQPTLQHEEPACKRRRRLSGKQSGAKKDNSLLSYAGLPDTRSLEHLPAGLLAHIMGFTDFRTKVSTLLVASRCLRQAMQPRAVWDPLHLDQATCKAFLVQMKRHDLAFRKQMKLSLPTRGHGVAFERCFPRGLFKVLSFSVVLMAPDKPQHEESDTDDEGAVVPPPLIQDPLGEMCSIIRWHFTSVEEFMVTNIDVSLMDYKFLIRRRRLQEFSYVEVQHCTHENGSYQLRARRNSEPLSLVNMQAVMRENKSRIPPNASFVENTTLSEREALFLLEHRGVYKNGEQFHIIHHRLRAISPHLVRKLYKEVVESLRQRFPSQFQPPSHPATKTTAGLLAVQH